jgi:hypothetical protein
MIRRVILWTSITRDGRAPVVVSGRGAAVSTAQGTVNDSALPT